MISRDSSQVFRTTPRDFCDCGTVPEPSAWILFSSGCRLEFAAQVGAAAIF